MRNARGVLAEFPSPETIVAAVRVLRLAGMRDVETYTPFDVPGLSRDLGLPKSRLPRLVFVAGLAGALASYLVQWYANAVAYPVNAGGRPDHAMPAFIFPTFEGLVLAGAAAAFLGCLVALRLPEHWDPVFDVDGFQRASLDRFFLEVRGADVARASELLREAGAVRVLPPGAHA